MRPRTFACLVTRGDHDLAEIHAELWPMETVVYDNSTEPDVAVWGRYRAAEQAKQAELVYVQDDDCVLGFDAIRELVDAWQPGHLVANQPAAFRHDFYDGHCLVGFGAVFERKLARDAFRRFWKGRDARTVDWGWFSRTCDIAFTGLVPRILADVPYRNLPWATDETRMYRQPEHVGERKRMLELVKAIR